MSELVEIFGVLKKDTEQAILISDGMIDVWIPKSQITNCNFILLDCKDHIEEGIFFTIPEWIAIDKELI